MDSFNVLNDLSKLPFEKTQFVLYVNQLNHQNGCLLKIQGDPHVIQGVPHVDENPSGLIEEVISFNLLIFWNCDLSTKGRILQICSYIFLQRRLSRN